MNLSSLLLAAVELCSPINNETVTLISDGQRAIITNETLEVREEIFAKDRKSGKKIRHDPYWRKSLPVVFKWRVTDGERGPWELLVSKKSDLSDARQYLFNLSKTDAATGRTEKDDGNSKLYSYEPPCLNLEIGERYYWRVTARVTCGNHAHARVCSCKNRKPMVTSAVGSFVTEDLAPRWIKVEGRVGNFRDLGGRRGLGGRRVRQGMIYRSQGLNDNSVDGVAVGHNRLTVWDVEYLTKTLGIRTDLDIRTECETAGLNGVSPLGKGVRFINRSSHCYAGIFTDEGKRVMAANFRDFLDRKNYPILFHCIGGADRTGSLGYVLNAVLGVKRQELETDWESTFYPNIPDQAHSKDSKFWCLEAHFTRGFGAYGDANTSWNDRVILYLKDCGITDREIATFRDIMLQ